MQGNRTVSAPPNLRRSSVRQLGAAVVSGLIDFSRRKPLGAIGAIIMVVLILIALLAPVISPHDPYAVRSDYLFAKPGGYLPLGGDSQGRDVMSRLFYGARVSLFVGLVSVGIGITIGSLIGVVSAYIGGKFDIIIQRLVDAKD